MPTSALAEKYCEFAQILCENATHYRRVDVGIDPYKQIRSIL